MQMLKPETKPVSKTGLSELTGNRHLEFQRDHSTNQYKLQRGDEEVPLDKAHFHPVFFANDVEQLRNNPEAQKTLKKFRIFVAPEEVEAAIQEGAKKIQLEMGITESLQVKQRQDQVLQIKIWNQHETELKKKEALLLAEQARTQEQKAMQNRVKGFGTGKH